MTSENLHDIWNKNGEQSIRLSYLTMTCKRYGVYRLILRVAIGMSLCLLWAVAAFFFVRTFSSLPQSLDERRNIAVKHLMGLREAVRNQDAPRKMQESFPEGACFTVTLYGLSWTNLVRNFDVEKELREKAIVEATWALEQYEQPYVVGPFTTTQVRYGVFWLGQRNLVLGQLLEILPESRRPKHLVEEFHTNTKSLAEAFLGSPTGHLDSYPGLCWPADNVTALASLLLHDKLYSTQYRIAYEHWREWTLNNPDPHTGLPAGHLDSRTGYLLQPARGCANSWVLALLPEMDSELALDLYGLYRKYFLVTRLGFNVFREYPSGLSRSADVDSGPILMGAGTTATGVGLGASIANSDLETAEDIYDLVSSVGLKHETNLEGVTGTQYLFGRVPVADAFLTWAFTLPMPDSSLTAPKSLVGKLWARRIPTAIFILLSVVSFWYMYRLIRIFKHWKQGEKDSPAASP